ncbi:MAG: hypothetical protein U5K30_11930 [Acidimicrobiales bacterium]|nr:hypothetical protein [Acidimicrobiales bacterium]
MDADDVAHDYYARIRLRARFEQAPEFWPTQNVLPLYTERVMRLRSIGRSLGMEPNEIHSALVRRLYPRAATIPYLDEKPPEAARQEPADARPLMQVLRTQQVDERRPTLERITSDETNPAWEHLDRHSVRGAVEHAASLRPPVRRRLYGAITALVWIDQVTGSSGEARWCPVS